MALKNELIVDRLASLDVRAGYDTIRAELMDLESQMKQIQDSVETFKRLQQRFTKWHKNIFYNKLYAKLKTIESVIVMSIELLCKNTLYV